MLAGVRCFMGTCAVAGRAPVPADEDTLCHFAATLAEEGLRHKTIKSAEVRHLHISEGRDDPFSGGLHRLHYILRGVKRYPLSRRRMFRRHQFFSPLSLTVKSVKQALGLREASSRWALDFLPLGAVARQCLL